MEEVIVELSVGKVTLKRPTAGIRNNAMIKAETPQGIKNTLMMVEILPHCVKAHPFGVTPLRQALDNLSIKDYDKLVSELAPLVMPQGDAEKKSETPSDASTITQQEDGK